MSRPVVNAAHGTYSRYRKGCRCDECMAASRAHATGGDHRSGRLLVECWCRRDGLLVHPSTIKSGETLSCGRPGCEKGAA